MKIDGVSYKFKPGTTRPTQRRFVGYIAQQIESVVPSAVQLIDGILHVDYESLIPYLSESIKQNFYDIKHHKHELQKIHELIDKLFAEFTQFKQSYHESSPPKTTKFHSTATHTTRHTLFRLIVGLCVVAAVVVSAVLGVLIVLHQHITPLSSSTVPLTDHAANYPSEWREFFDATNGAHWVNNTGWLTNSDLCTWFGITCDGRGKVTMLHLNNNNLAGSIPNNFRNVLGDLKVLDLGHNSLSGQIPPNFGLLMNLQKITLSHNNLFGQIPPFTRGRNDSGTVTVVYLDLSSNLFTGTIPSFEPLTFWRVIDMSSNSLEGSVPKISLMMQALLNFSHNMLSELDWTVVTTTEKLDISHNSFTGTVFLPVGSAVKEWDISYNSFTGFEDYLTNGTLIKSCNASRNYFKCPIPHWIKERCNATCHNIRKKL